MLATALLPELTAAGHQVVAYPRAKLDVTDHDAFVNAAGESRCDWIAHLAAFTRVDACESEREHAQKVNGLGARNAALAASKSGAAVLLISTDYVFDGISGRPYRPYDAVAPASEYGRSKWAGEQAVREVLARHLVVRTSWLFGRGGPNFIDTILARARSGQPLSVVDDQRGSPTWTRHLAAQLVRLIASAQYGTYHCTNSGDCTWHELAEFALSASGAARAVGRMSSAALGRPAPRPTYSVLDNGWTEHVTGVAMPHWREGVKGHLADTAAATATAGRP